MDSATSAQTANAEDQRREEDSGGEGGRNRTPEGGRGGEEEQREMIERERERASETPRSGGEGRVAILATTKQ